MSFFVFRLSHHIAVLFLRCLGGKKTPETIRHCKKYFFFCHFSSFMQNLQQIAEMHRCDSNRVWRRRGKKNPTETRSESCKVEKTSTSNHNCDWLEAESLETWSVPLREQRAADAHNPLTAAAVHSQWLFPLFLLLFLLFPSFFHPSHQHRHSLKTTASSRRRSLFFFPPFLLVLSSVLLLLLSKLPHQFNSMYRSLWFIDNQWTTAAVLLPLPTLRMVFFLTASIFRAIAQPAASVRPRRDPAGHVPTPLRDRRRDLLSTGDPTALHLTGQPRWTRWLSPLEQCHFTTGHPRGDNDLSEAPNVVWNYQKKMFLKSQNWEVCGFIAAFSVYWPFGLTAAAKLKRTVT